MVGTAAQALIAGDESHSLNSALSVVFEAACLGGASAPLPAGVLAGLTASLSSPLPVAAASTVAKKKFVTTGRGEKIEVRDGGFVANNPALYAIVDATESLGFARKAVRVVSVGVGEYPPPKLPAWSLRKWASKLPTMVFLQKTMEISTQSMDQLRKVLFRDVETTRIHAKYTQPEMATDLLEVDLEKLGLLWQRGRDCARDVESDLRKFLT